MNAEVIASIDELNELVAKIWEPVLQMSDEDEGRGEAVEEAIKMQQSLYKQFFQAF
jgi:hypothetical protein